MHFAEAMHRTTIRYAQKKHFMLRRPYATFAESSVSDTDTFPMREAAKPKILAKKGPFCDYPLRSFFLFPGQYFTEHPNRL